MREALPDGPLPERSLHEAQKEAIARNTPRQSMVDAGGSDRWPTLQTSPLSGGDRGCAAPLLATTSGLSRRLGDRGQLSEVHVADAQPVVVRGRPSPEVGKSRLPGHIVVK